MHMQRDKIIIRQVTLNLALKKEKLGNLNFG